MPHPLLLAAGGAVIGSARRDLTRFAVLGAAAVGGLVALRYFSVRTVNAAERLAESLLDTDRLADARRKLPAETENALAACAAYLVGAAYSAALGAGVPGTEEDPVGHSRTHTHNYSNATATVLTEANTPDLLLTYSVSIPDVGEVRGTRRVGGLKMTGLAPNHPGNDVAQVTLGDDYTAQFEAEFEVANFLATGKTRLTGPATLRDNRDNVGRLHVAHDGSVSGTITRENRVIGRFHGSIETGVFFAQNEIPAPEEPDVADGEESE